jgi:hypothetical protein
MEFVEVGEAGVYNYDDKSIYTLSQPYSHRQKGDIITYSERRALPTPNTG